MEGNIMRPKIKNTILSIFLALIAFLGIFFTSLLTNFSLPLIMNKASSTYSLKAADKYYDLPVYIHYCYYDCQNDIAYIAPNNDYYIENENFNSLSYMKQDYFNFKK